MIDCQIRWLPTSNRSYCAFHQRDEIECVKEELRHTKLQVGALKKFVEAYGHIDHASNCVCAPCVAWDEAKCLLEHGRDCAEKRIQEPPKYEHGDDVSDDAMRG